MIGGGNWTGNFHNSDISSDKNGSGIFATKWNGKISNSIITIKRKDSHGIIIASSSKGTISKSTIYAKKRTAVFIPKSVKINNVKVKSGKLI
ncbi:hypothetical protein ALNOE001_18460 [Candidatus Methanobinarius endosymbioticus]|uniref:Right handed beta helix domain-containing protein n=1 Tax=Candidatus Methanobinarius endosymbioticus TaxID=2006182 RepID=A0A366M978_9EURY|nr:hypothetical protein ALNOE001_18460 [Candidatus Methanobinarius endosymbioticus]